MNSRNLGRLKIEMSREQVLADLKEPYRSKTMLMQNVEFMELLNYHTDLKSLDGAVTDDELTPIVLIDGRVIGWG